MSEMSTSSSESKSTFSSGTSLQPIKIRYKFGMAPDRIIDTDPSVMETVRAMDKVDGAVFIGTTLIPAIYGYRIQSKH